MQDLTTLFISQLYLQATIATARGEHTRANLHMAEIKRRDEALLTAHSRGCVPSDLTGRWMA